MKSSVWLGLENIGDRFGNTPASASHCFPTLGSDNGAGRRLHDVLSPRGATGQKAMEPDENSSSEAPRDEQLAPSLGQPGDEARDAVLADASEASRLCLQARP